MFACQLEAILSEEFTGDRLIPRKKASNAENISIWWRHHVTFPSVPL